MTLQAEDLIRRVAKRCKLADDTVRRTLETMADIVHEEVAIMEPVVIPKIGKVNPRQHRCNSQKNIVEVVLFKTVAEAVGRDLIPIQLPGAPKPRKPKLRCHS